ncbi:glucose 1-dehydrogenase [Deinococcus psychrotolerans]|uniref:Glucose 1-dehydrogenase n=1 Tax=Deinococcus psychrotolerans TaxID=2489213 RepID=A0A3G8YBC1_9DEIO|nr:glucose 1-dehydrogenase [Deinococcus psychrotolerans]AZI41497.1 glucose 1-dehydrogenase [Deinococcus psychrotolerans]
MDITLNNQRALVTGANSGIGEAVVRGLAASGARVVVNYVSHPEAADKIVQDIQAAGGEAFSVLADVSDPAQVAAMFAQIDSHYGGLDILVNNAGIDGAHALSWDADPAAWLRVLQINLFGSFLCAQQALKRMVPQKSGVILNITSVHDQIAWSGYSAYTASKGGESMMMKTLAQEAAPFGVRVLAVAPGAVRTPINQSVWSDPTTLADLLTKIPLGRMGETTDIANMVVFLCSAQASYVTGTTIYVDGAMTDFPAFSHGG